MCISSGEQRNNMDTRQIIGKWIVDSDIQLLIINNIFLSVFLNLAFLSCFIKLLLEKAVCWFEQRYFRFFVQGVGVGVPYRCGHNPTSVLQSVLF